MSAAVTKGCYFVLGIQSISTWGPEGMGGRVGGAGSVEGVCGREVGGGGREGGSRGKKTKFMIQARSSVATDSKRRSWPSSSEPGLQSNL